MHVKQPLIAITSAGVLMAGLAACSPSDPQGDSIRFALDWSLNTNHIGIVVAQEKGYFADAGLDVEILPLASSTPIQQITDGEADFGISEQTGIQISRTQGHPVTSVYQVVQQETGVMIYSPDRADITRPADLDGLTFGGFGDPIWTTLAETIITGDGGQGEFDDVVLDSDVYSALDSGEVDFTLSVVSWENILAEMQGQPYPTFDYETFGVPPSHTISIVGSDEFIEDNPDATRLFVKAVQQGYAYAVDDPAGAADLLIGAHPDLFDGEEELVHASTALLAEEYFTANGIELGVAQPGYWEDHGQFLVDQGMLTDPNGQVLDHAPDWSDFYTNEYVTD